MVFYEDLCHLIKPFNHTYHTEKLEVDTNIQTDQSSRGSWKTGTEPDLAVKILREEAVGDILGRGIEGKLYCVTDVYPEAKLH